MCKQNLVLIAVLSAVILPLFFMGTYELSATENTAELTLSPQPETVNNLTRAKDSVETQSVQKVSARGQFGWESLFIDSAEFPWAAEEVVMVRKIVTNVIEALDGQGLDGRTLLNGYRFRRQYGEYITGHEGRIAVVNHEEQTITLADAAFKRLHGFYIIHELGHVVDRRTNRQLSAAFHNLAGSDKSVGKTADGYWLNLHAGDDLEEATADAFALWIMAVYDTDYRPIFAYTPADTDLQQIEALFDVSISSVSTTRGRNGLN